MEWGFVHESTFALCWVYGQYVYSPANCVA